MRKHRPPGYEALWFLTGFLSIGAQVIVLRALVVVFSGDEMIIGPALFAWAVWIGGGSYIAGRAGILRGPEAMRWTLAVAAVLAPLTYSFVYVAKYALGVSPALVVNPVSAFLFIVAVLAPLCVVSGAAFSIGCGLAGESSSRAVALAYLWDALGAAVGGLLAGGLLTPRLSATSAVFMLTTVTGVTLMAQSAYEGKWHWARSMAWGFIALPSLALVFSSVPSRWLNEIAWRGYPIVAERDSRYSHLVMVEREGERTLFVNGSPTLSNPAGESAEATACVALAVNPDARRVLLIGGGLTTVGEKLLEGPIDRLDYCRLDPVAIDMERTIHSTAWLDPRVSVHAADGRSFVREAEPGSWDLMVLDVGDPDTLAHNRYYTREFFISAKRALKPEGVLFFGVGEYANYVSREQAVFLKSLAESLDGLFGNRTIYPLGLFRFAISSSRALPGDGSEIARRIDSLGLRPKYFRVGDLAYDLSPDRLELVRRAISRAGNVTPNEDYNPVGYTYSANFRLSRFFGSGSMKDPTVAGVSLFSPLPWFVTAIVAFIILVPLIAKRGAPWGYGPLIFGVGFQGMAVEIMVLYMIQVAMGAFYGYLGVAVTAYMVGLSLGAWLSRTRRVAEDNGGYFPFIITLGFGMTPPLLLIAMSLVDPGENESAVLLPFLVVLLLLTALLFGYIFGAAAGFRERVGAEAGRIGGILNLLDMAGGAVAALIVAPFMLPRWGYAATGAAAMLLYLLSTVAPGLGYASRVSRSEE